MADVVEAFEAILNCVHDDVGGSPYVTLHILSHTNTCQIEMVHVTRLVLFIVCLPHRYWSRLNVAHAIGRASHAYHSHSSHNYYLHRYAQYCDNTVLFGVFSSHICGIVMCISIHGITI